jgi:hypothetical protein
VVNEHYEDIIIINFKNTKFWERYKTGAQKVIILFNTIKRSASLTGENMLSVTLLREHDVFIFASQVANSSEPLPLNCWQQLLVLR